MRLKCLPLIALVVAVVASPAGADSNATGGDVISSETKSLGAGPFYHGGDVGISDNTTISGITFDGGFQATHIRFSGTLTSVIEATYASEAFIQIRQGLTSADWQNPGTDDVFDSFYFNSSQLLSGGFGGGYDPGAGGAWDIEFFDDFDDDAGEDSQSTNVEMTFEERTAFSDENGDFDLGSLNVGESANSIGEFAVESIYDTYSITLNQAGLLTVGLEADPTGFVGNTLDTQLAIFDADGFLIEEDDDGGSGLYDQITDLELAAGNYTIAVAPYFDGTTFEDGWVVNPGTETGDYAINASLTAVPEPGTSALLGFGFLGLLASRRRS